MKYRKKPIVIDAWRNDGRSLSPQWLANALNEGSIYFSGGEEPYYTIETREGVMRAEFGDWIIRGIAGELYPCKPDIFASTYEFVDQGAVMQTKGPNIRDYADAIERIAFSIPAPNEFTPLLEHLVMSMRQQHYRRDEDSVNAGIDAAYNCILREAIVDLDRNSEPEVIAQFEKYRPALELLRKTWPWLRGPHDKAE